MFYEEKVIDGILHHRGTPNGFWQPYTARRLTEMMVEERTAKDAEIAKLNATVDRFAELERSRWEAARAAFGDHVGRANR